MIESLLKEHLSPTYLEVINESHLHKGHQDFENPRETHFKVVIASPKFKGKSKVMRHRDVYKALEKCFQQGLHSLVIEDSEGA